MSKKKSSRSKGKLRRKRSRSKESKESKASSAQEAEAGSDTSSGTSSAAEAVTASQETDHNQAPEDLDDELDQVLDQVLEAPDTSDALGALGSTEGRQSADASEQEEIIPAAFRKEEVSEKVSLPRKASFEQGAEGGAKEAKSAKGAGDSSGGSDDSARTPAANGPGAVVPAPYSGQLDPTGGEGSFVLSVWFFLRGLGVVYLCAFVSTWFQIIGLFGEQGIMPISSFLKTAGAAGGFWKVPTLFWWGTSDVALHLLCGAGALLSVLLILDLFPVLMLSLTWLLYLSIVSSGRGFFSYQWDMLLLETGFLAIWLGSWRLRPKLIEARQPPVLVLWMFWLLLFRLMFFSGWVKLAHDVVWRDFSALQYHYWTQPLPSFVSWYVHQLPSWFHQLSVILMLAIELLAPFFMLGTRVPRMIAGLAIIFLQLCIILTGNYGFFNVLTICLCILLFDDAVFRTLLPARWSQLLPSSLTPPALSWKQRAPKLLLMGIVLPGLLLLTVWKEAQRFDRWAYTKPKPASSIPGFNWYHKVNRAVAYPVKKVFQALSLRKASATTRKMYYQISKFRWVNRYGLFAVMTKTRPEIIIEGSLDGQNWKPYVFKWKPGDPKRAPGIAGPHMPRLDWQMWFAALSPRPQQWMANFCIQLLKGSPPVLALLGKNPFPEDPPKYVRAILYQYKFATPNERSQEGAWWSRKRKRLFFGPIKLSTTTKHP